MEKITTLGKKPLVEAIFELRWELGNAIPGTSSDPLYDIMVGAMLTKLRANFPVHVRLPAADVPGMMIPWQVQHQFRHNAGWPLVQLGSGIITINETDTYSSQTFLTMCASVYSLLVEFWGENGTQPKIINANLRYIDAEELDGRPIESLLGELDVNLNLGERIRRSKRLQYDFEALQLALRLKCSEPESLVTLGFNRGFREAKDALIWETSVSSEGDSAASFSANPEKWLNAAHDVAHELFFSMIEGNLLEKYK